MNNFSYHNPTKILFGKNCLDSLGTEVAKSGSKALIIIGKGSAKTNGSLNQVIKQLKNKNISYKIFEGVKSNPEVRDAEKALAIALEADVDFIIAIGGGSVIDTAKGVAIGYYAAHPIWGFYQYRAPQPIKALPIYTVLTLAATGSEMNKYTVLQDTTLGIKAGFGHDLLYPVCSFLNPSFTITVSDSYTAYGIADIISHTLEQYFSPESSPLSDKIALSIISECFEKGPKLMQDLTNYELRAEIMWLGTVALNGTLMAGKSNGDWGVHAYEHVLSALYNIPHGAGLSILYPAWIKQFHNQLIPKLEELNFCLPKSFKAYSFVENLEILFEKIGAPTRLHQLNLDAIKRDEVLKRCLTSKVNGVFYKMGKLEYAEIFDLMA